MGLSDTDIAELTIEYVEVVHGRSMQCSCIMDLTLIVVLKLCVCVCIA